MRTRFRLADGNELLGHCQPLPGEPPAYPPAYLRPCIVTLAGRIPLWLGGRVWKDARGRKRGEEPSQDEIARYYGLLARPREAVFPVVFAAVVALPAGFVAAGTVSAFGYMRGTEFAWVD